MLIFIYIVGSTLLIIYILGIIQHMSSIKITKRYYSSTATYTSKELFDIIKYKSHTCQVIHIEQTFDGNYRYVF